MKTLAKSILRKNLACIISNMRQLHTSKVILGDGTSWHYIYDIHMMFTRKQCILIHSECTSDVYQKEYIWRTAEMYFGCGAWRMIYELQLYITWYNVTNMWGGGIDKMSWKRYLIGSRDMWVDSHSVLWAML